MKGKKWLMAALAMGVLTPAGVGAVTPTYVYAAMPTLQLGDTGASVKTLQTALNAKGYSCGTPDGVFGKATQSAVESFQKDHHLTVDGVVGPATWSALGLSGSSTGSGGSTSGSSGSPGQRDLHSTQIWMNGKQVNSPMAFVWNNTTYIPIWYVEQALATINIQSTWDGTHWNLKLPQGMTANFSNPPIDVGTGSLQIEINGKLVKRVDGIVYKDPATGYKTTTTYMPIWYVMNELQRVGVVEPTDWDGTNWYMAQQSTLFTVYNANGTKVKDYYSKSDAQAAASTVPGAVVKDGYGNVVYKVPDYRAFSGPGQVVGDYTSQQAAAASIQNQPQGYVVDALANIVVQYPANYYYLNGDQWTSSQSGPTGTAAPTFATTGEKYLLVNGKYYLLVTTDGHYSGKLVSTNSSENPYQNVDLRFPAPSSVTASVIDQWLTSHSSPLAGLGASFIRAQNSYGVDATYLVSHAIIETAWGTSSIYQAKNNLFGFGAYDSNPADYAGTFPSSDYAIQYEAYFVRNDYLEPGSMYYVTPTLDGMNQHYATDPNWSSGIANVMQQFVTETGGKASDYPQYPQNVQPPVSAGKGEPIYRMNHATATVSSSAIGQLGVFSDPGTGSSNMFPGTQQVSGSYNISSAVKKIQSLVGTTADGIYGPMTKQAVATWQSQHDLSATGVVDATTWNTMFPANNYLPNGTKLVVDSMEQGYLANSIVTEWCHVTASNGVSGWVDENYLTFTNVYRAQVKGGYDATVYAGDSRSSSHLDSVHVGDYVVTNTPSPDGAGMIPILWVNQQTGQQMTAYLDGQVVQLSKLPAPTSYRK